MTRTAWVVADRRRSTALRRLGIPAIAATDALAAPTDLRGVQVRVPHDLGRQMGDLRTGTVAAVLEAAGARVRIAERSAPDRELLTTR